MNCSCARLTAGWLEACIVYVVFCWMGRNCLIKHYMKGNAGRELFNWLGGKPLCGMGRNRGLNQSSYLVWGAKANGLDRFGFNSEMDDMVWFVNWLWFGFHHTGRFSEAACVLRPVKCKDEQGRFMNHEWEILRFRNCFLLSANADEPPARALPGVRCACLVFLQRTTGWTCQ